MPAPNERITAPKRLFFAVAILFSSLFIFSAVVFPQTSLNDVHISSIEKAPPLTGSLGTSQLAGGTISHVLKTEVSLVLVPVSVTDPQQRLVTGLELANFEIFEGKKPQVIRHFSSEDMPASVGIIIDASGSMRNKMDRVRDAVHQFCEAANLQDEFFLIAFSDKPRLVTDFTSSPEDIEKELLFTQSKGRTSLLDAIYLGLRKMKDAKRGKKALLVISDGGDNNSRYTEKDVKRAAKESDVLLYTIGIFDRYAPSEEEIHGPALLSDIAQTTGGRAFTVQNPVELPAIAHRVAVELRTQYLLAYRPQDQPRDGKWHRIKVKLRLPRKLSFLQAHARSGYYSLER
jgi:Ca-activated chloride channel family protein